MGLYDQFPYRNFHELNLAWLLAQVKLLKEKMTSLETLPNVLDYGAIADGVTDNTVAFQTALNNNTVVYVPEGDYAVGTIDVPSDRTLLVDGQLIAKHAPLFEITNEENVLIAGGKYSTTVANATCFSVNNSDHVTIRDAEISSFTNKGVALVNSKCCLIENVKVEGADGVTGGGISLAGTSSYNTVTACCIKNSRIGVILQSSSYNNASNISIEDCYDMGLCFDGTISGTGDGAYCNNVTNLQISGQTNSSYGGVYFGNGSHQNVVSNFNITDCHTGIRSSGGTGYEPVKNRIADGVITNCTAKGINLSLGNYTSIENILIDTCVTGIHLFKSDCCTISNCTLLNNTAEGALIQSGYCMVIACKVMDNGTGIKYAYGGSTPDANSMLCNTFNDNTVDADLSGSPTEANNINYTP